MVLELHVTWATFLSILFFFEFIVFYLAEGITVTNGRAIVVYA